MRAALLVALLGGCQYTGTFECAASEQCRGPGATAGACIAGSCAHGDAECSAGYRFAESAAVELAGACLETVPPANCAAWKPLHITPCDLPIPIGAIQIVSTATYDTDSGELTPPIPHTSIVVAQTSGGMVRIISASTLTVATGATLRVTGSLPLVIAAWDSITIAGRIDAGSERAGATGPGANALACSAALPGMAAIERGSGGGGAGGFQGTGGDGGSAGYPMVAMGGTGGVSVPTTMLTANVRGGCPGAASGVAGVEAMAPATATSTAAGGAGGGAIHLTAQRSIEISGAVRAGGAGGFGAPVGSFAGGGGGGSGGYLGLEAPMITVAGGLSANGGGGGGGATGTVDGKPGSDGSNVGGRGGAAATDCSGEGATGSSGGTLAGGDASNNPRICGGGGGGGGAGVIAVRSAMYTATATANISPPIVVVPP